MEIAPLNLLLDSAWDHAVRQIIQDQDFLHPDGWFALPPEKFIVSKRDFAFNSGVWRGEPVQPLINRLKFARGNSAVLVHSDIHTHWRHSMRLLGAGARMIWGANVDPILAVASSVPLGLTSPEPGSAIHSLLSMREPLAAAFDSTARPEKLRCEFYVNINPATHPSRRRFLEQIAEVAGVTLVEPDQSESGRLEYLKSLRSSSFVLAPRGNGIDSHRLWETLYMGGIPIIIKTPSITPLVRSLPVVQIATWADLSRHAVIRAELDRISAMSLAPERLRLTWWLALLQRRHAQRLSRRIIRWPG